MEKFCLSQVSWLYVQFIFTDFDYSNTVARPEGVSCTWVIFQKCFYNLWVAPVFCVWICVHFSSCALVNGIPTSVPDGKWEMCTFACVLFLFHLASYCSFCSLWKLDNWLPQNCFCEKLPEKIQVTRVKKANAVMVKLKQHAEDFTEDMLNWSV